MWSWAEIVLSVAKLSIRLMGVRGAFIDQTTKVLYQGGTAVPAGETDRSYLTNNFGVSACGGFDTLWGLSHGGFTAMGELRCSQGNLKSGNRKNGSIQERSALALKRIRTILYKPLRWLWACNGIICFPKTA